MNVSFDYVTIILVTVYLECSIKEKVELGG